MGRGWNHCQTNYGSAEAMSSNRRQADKNHNGTDNTVDGVEKNPTHTRADLTLILVLLAIFLFHSPFTTWWTSLGLPWYSFFVFWLILIVLSAFNQRKTNTST